MFRYRPRYVRKYHAKPFTFRPINSKSERQFYAWRTIAVVQCKTWDIFVAYCDEKWVLLLDRSMHYILHQSIYVVPLYNCFVKSITIKLSYNSRVKLFIGMAAWYENITCLPGWIKQTNKQFAKLTIYTLPIKTHLVSTLRWHRNFGHRADSRLALSQWETVLQI